MAYNFPQGLNTVLQATFSREETVTFATSQPASGPYYVQITSDDAPCYFACEWVFNESEALAFRAFMRQNNSDVANGAQFYISLPVEGGNAMQLASFTPDGVPQMTSKERGLFRYRGRLMVRKLNEIGAGNEAQILAAFNQRPIGRCG